MSPLLRNLFYLTFPSGFCDFFFSPFSDLGKNLILHFTHGQIEELLRQGVFCGRRSYRRRYRLFHHFLL